MERTMRVAIVISGLLLSACTTHAQQTSASLDSTLDAMVGQSVDVAIAWLGEPIGSAPMGQDLVYGWGKTFTSTEYTNAAPGFVEAADFKGGVFPAPRHTVQNNCVIRMVVGADGLIRDWDYQGTDRGCRAYADRPGSHAMLRAD
jgi:hypothetical protein